jgi:hypothetical protein
VGLRLASELCWRSARRARLRDVPDRALKEKYGIEESDHFHTMTIQDTGGTQKTIADGIARIHEMLPVANTATRETVPASELMVALQCGGSDGYSGITANAALGYATDLLVKQGGTGVLAETPEIYGAEHLLTARAPIARSARSWSRSSDWWERLHRPQLRLDGQQPLARQQEAGGLTTILEKSLGAAAKGGTTPLNGVYKYAEPVTAKGFTFMDSPGYDPASVTGQIASGCNLVTFTTGRGSAFGCQAVAIDEGGHQFRDVRPHDRGHGHRRRPHPDRRRDGRGGRARDLRDVAAHGLGRALESERAGIGRPRVRAVADRGGDVACVDGSFAARTR